MKPATITKIELSQSDLDKLKKVLQSQKMGPMAKDLHQRKIVGSCNDCGIIPEYNVIRYYDGATRIERYCESCLSKEKKSGNIDFKQ